MAMGVTPIFPGSRPFTRAESGKFFGRAAEAASLVAEWQRNPLTFLDGPAGIGKTSLLAAGVLPFVEGRGSTLKVLPVAGVSARHVNSPGGVAACPVAALRQHNPYSFSVLQSWSGATNPTRFAGMPIDDFIDEYVRYHPNALILAAIDHADDLFAGPPARQPFQRRFLAELAAALEYQPGLRLLISVRSDALAGFTAALGDGVRVSLDPLTPDGALEAVAKPGYFAPDVAADLVHTLRVTRLAPGHGEERVVVADEIEPALLQVVCARLWETLRAHVSQVTGRELRNIRDFTVDAALTGYCRSAIADVAAVHGIPVDWLRNWLIDTIVTEVGELHAAEERGSGEPIAVRALEDRHLLRARVGQGSAQSAGARERFYRLLSDRLAEPLRQTVFLTRDLDGDTSGETVAATADADEYLRAVERARMMGKYDVAAKIAGHALRLIPERDLRGHAETYSLMGDLAYEQGDTDSAEKSYKTAIRLFQVCNDNFAVGRLFAAVARTLIDRGRLVDALQELASAISRVPDLTLQDELADVMAALAQQSAQTPPFRSTPA